MQATDTMKQVFHIYFAIIKRVPSHALLEPVLEGEGYCRLEEPVLGYRNLVGAWIIAGLSKFAHLLNVEFFADMIKCMEGLVDERVT